MFSQSQTRNCTPISAPERRPYLLGIVQGAAGVSENKMDLPHLCTCAIVSGSMLFTKHFVFLAGLYCELQICVCARLCVCDIDLT